MYEVPREPQASILDPVINEGIVVMASGGTGGPLEDFRLLVVSSLVLL